MPRLVATGERHPLIEVQHAEDRVGPRVYDLAQSQTVPGENRLPERLRAASRADHDDAASSPP